CSPAAAPGSSWLVTSPATRARAQSVMRARPPRARRQVPRTDVWVALPRAPAPAAPRGRRARPPAPEAPRRPHLAARARGAAPRPTAQAEPPETRRDPPRPGKPAPVGRAHDCDGARPLQSGHRLDTDPLPTIDHEVEGSDGACVQQASHVGLADQISMLREGR